MKKNSRLTLFFILVFCLFYLFVNLNDCWFQKLNIENKQFLTLFTSLLFTLIITSIYMLSKFQNDKSESFWDISPAALCKGGPYFWQGDSPTSKMCRKLASTEEGRVMLSGYNCPVGYVGQPGLPFYYTPLSDDNWQNRRCDSKNCPLQNSGMCSFERQVP